MKNNFFIISKIFLLLIFISINVFTYIKLDEKNKINLNVVTEQNEENKKIEEEKTEKETKKIQFETENTLEYKLTNSEVILSGYDEELNKFLKDYLNAKYTYESNSDEKNLEKFYSENLKKEFLKNKKNYKEHPKYRIKSKLGNQVEIFKVTKNSEVFFAVTLNNVEEYIINKLTNIETEEKGNKFFYNSYRIIKENGEYKIEEAIEKLITNLSIGE